MARVLVTGGAGFIGSHIVEALLRRGDSVRVLDDLSTGHLHNLAPWLPDLEFIEGDCAAPVVARRAVEGVELVFHAFDDMVGGEIYVKKIPSMKVVDIARAIAPEARHEIVGIRPGEKLHEQMIAPEDALHTYEYPEHYKILPAIFNWSQDPVRINGGKPVGPDFTYSSDNNVHWMTADALLQWMHRNRDVVGSV
jgi:FlaA1/EpsC-like NDP-sugar epimerase